MKKNMVTILILALVVINVVLSAVIIFVVVPTSSKTNKLVTDIVSIVNLELEGNKDTVTEEKVSVTDTETYLIEQKLTPNLKLPEGETQVHYASMESVTLSLNKNAKGYKKLKATLATNQSFITEAVNDVFSSHTLVEANANRDSIKAEIIAKLQAYFESDFIINVSFGNLTFS